MKTIEVIVSPQGKIRIETKGFAGGECQEATKKLELALGTVTSDQKTAESFLPTATVQQVRS